MRKIIYLAGYAVAFGVIFYASSALAATPQEIINNALSQYNPDNGLSMSGDILVEVRENITDKTYVNGPELAIFDINFSQRSLPRDKEGYQDGEGYLRFKKFSLEDATHEFKIDEPITVFWRNVKPMSYFKIDRLPITVDESLSETGINLNAITQRWFTMEDEQESSFSQILPNLGAEDADPMGKILTMFKNLGDKKFLQVLRTEKRYKNTAGEEIARVRVGVNRGVLYQEYQKDLREAYKIIKYTERMEAIKKAREEYNDNLKDAGALHMAANLNLSQNTMERIEFGIIQTKDKEKCDWNDEWTEKTCKKVGTSTVKLQTGIWFNQPDHSPVLVPYNAIDLNDADEFFMQMFAF
jgi:hypothetical protein